MHTNRQASTSNPALNTRLDRIAAGAVRLGALGPRLARLSQDMAAQAKAQADRARVVAENMDRLTTQLDVATRQLQGSSREVESALATVSRMAEHTRILAINASIEAARAGAQGRAFGVVVDEVQRLADDSGRTTKDIDERLQEMRASIARVTSMTDQAAADDRGATPAALTSVGAVNQQIRGIAESVGQQLASVELLNNVGADVNTVTSALLLDVGTFRFAAHARAERQLSTLVAEIAKGGLIRQRIEQVMAGWIEQHPHFELVYVTDAAGRQIVDNIASRDGRAAHDESGYQRDWSARPWYRDAAGSESVCSTDIYRSSATGDFCFTIAASLRDPDGKLRCVVAADVNFQQLVAD